MFVDVILAVEFDPTVVINGTYDLYNSFKTDGNSIAKERFVHSVQWM